MLGKFHAQEIQMQEVIHRLLTLSAEVGACHDSIRVAWRKETPDRLQTDMVDSVGAPMFSDDSPGSLSPHWRHAHQVSYNLVSTSMNNSLSPQSSKRRMRSEPPNNFPDSHTPYTQHGSHSYPPTPLLPQTTFPSKTVRDTGVGQLHIKLDSVAHGSATSPSNFSDRTKCPLTSSERTKALLSSSDRTKCATLSMSTQDTCTPVETALDDMACVGASEVVSKPDWLDAA